MSSVVPQQQPPSDGSAPDRHPNPYGSGRRPSAVTDPNGPAPPRRSTSVRRTPSAGSALAGQVAADGSSRRVPTTPITTSFGTSSAVGGSGGSSVAHQHFASFQPAPWAFKPRAPNPPPRSAVEAANSAQAPNALGLKHDETTSPNAFVVDEDFERVVQELVPNFDYPETPSLTFRVFFLGTLFNIILAFANTIFSFRTNYFMLTSYVGILLAYPLGKFLESYAPDRTFYTRWFNLSLNPGPFTVKEHVLIGIWATTGASGAYGTSNIVVQELFYDLKLTHLTCIAFLVCLNLIGFGFSGLFRSWVIRPIEMTWPTVLPFVSLYSAFHGGLKRETHSDSDSVIDPKHQSKLRFFFIAIVICFAYHIIGPQYMVTGIASIPLLCFFFPSSNFFWRHVVGSPATGAGAFSVTLDWSVIGSMYQTVPFWTTLSQTLGTVALQWVVAPYAAYKNWFGTPTARPRFELNTSDIYTNSGALLSEHFDKLIAQPKTDGIKLDPAAYEALRPLHMSPLFAMAYFSSMAQFTSAFVHCIVWYGSSIWRRFRGVNKNKEGLDIHCLLIDQYDEVPQSVYIVLLALITVATVAVCQFSAMAMPWYMTLLSIGFSAVACFPIAIILATTGVQLYLNVVSQFLLGLLMPGFPIVQMAFKSLAVSVGQQCMFLLTDLKLGHYMKIPPRHVFITQITASIVSALVSYAATVFWLNNPDHHLWIKTLPQLLEEDGNSLAAQWGSAGNRVFYSASIIWGLVGPRRFFFETAYGAVILWGLVIGAMTPIVIKMLDLVSGKRIPWKYVQGPLLFNGVVPGGDQSFVFTGFLVALFFQFFMYRYRTNWWKRYNYILACALDVGVAIAAFVVTFGLEGLNIHFPEWALNPGDNDTLKENLNFCFVPKEFRPKV
ncbi:OPT oligopeptide transporter protein-domain-containing protein [Catenaria anguillulae PL171]|uniref:OPT oligopeptide transporter protein-domain-containing protein n=1 Tax=Catenaria anguillulae PL171 TaxID=765915 RepID=A0A1Y2HA62_9FUNG|nr:OPT oligopeptide transporter protein-domain-containing protein [Catenaria anguillulae PL171]